MTGNQILNNYFSLTHKDRTGIITIVLLICLASVSPLLIKIVSPKKHITADISWISALQQLEIKQSEKELSAAVAAKSLTRTYQAEETSNTHKGFYFDPNSASTEDWQKLGLRDKTIKTIQNYVAKGGSFQHPEDLKKIYGLYPDEYERLAPFIRIPEKNTASESNTHIETKASYLKSHTYAVTDINNADTSALITLPGIGSKLSARIVNFREKLGGFYSVEQIAETYGLPDSTFQKIKPYLELGTSSIKKININTATVEELKAHPYIKYNIANAIVAYRNQHGSFSKVEDIKKVMVVTDEIYNKVSLYLTAQ